MGAENLHPEITALDGLGALADSAGAPPPESLPGGAGGDTPPGPPDFGMEAAKAVDMLSAGIVGFAPQAAAIWTPETKANVTGALAPVFAKYGVLTSVVPCELVALFVAGPPLWASVRIVLAKLEADKAAGGKAVAKATAAGDGLAAEITAAAGAAEGGETAPAPKVAPQVALFKQ